MSCRTVLNIQSKALSSHSYTFRLRLLRNRIRMTAQRNIVLLTENCFTGESHENSQKCALKSYKAAYCELAGILKSLEYSSAPSGIIHSLLNSGKLALCGSSRKMCYQCVIILLYSEHWWTWVVSLLLDTFSFFKYSILHNHLIEIMEKSTITSSES